LGVLGGGDSVPLVPENWNNSPKLAGAAPPARKMRFQLYCSRIMLRPRRYAATENSIGMVGIFAGVESFSKNLRPLANTSLTMAGSTRRGRKSVLIIH